MSTEVLISFVLASTLLIIVPGPTVITIMSDSISSGIKKSIATITGAALAHTIYILVTAMGMSYVLILSLQYFIVIKWLGVSYLIAFGAIKIFSKKTEFKARNKKDKKGRVLFWQGFLVTISNPKAILFYAAFFPPFLDPNANLIIQYTILGWVFILLFIFLSILSAAFANRLSAVILKQNQSLIDRVSGIMMILAGLILSSIKSK